MDKIRLVETCYSCPEQYEAYLGGRQVAYFRLRHGTFRVRCPDPNGPVVFQGDPVGDGRFEDAERYMWLNAGCGAVLSNLGIPPPMGEDLFFVATSREKP